MRAPAYVQILYLKEIGLKFIKMLIKLEPIL